MELRYKHVERVVAEVFSVNETGIGRLRARIRHLHDAGLNPSRPGTGAAIDYSTQHVFILVVALVLDRLGHPPKSAAALAPSLARHYDEAIDGNQFVMVKSAEKLPGFEVGVFPKEQDFFKAVRGEGPEYAKAPPAYLVINLKFYSDAIKTALSRIESGR